MNTAKKTDTKKLSFEQMKNISGGTVSLGPFYIDDIINGPNYEKIANWILPIKEEPRTRPVENNSDIYDVEI